MELCPNPEVVLEPWAEAGAASSHCDSPPFPLAVVPTALRISPRKGVCIKALPVPCQGALESPAPQVNSTSTQTRQKVFSEPGGGATRPACVGQAELAIWGGISHIFLQ